jgi:hypothetical protein
MKEIKTLKLLKTIDKICNNKSCKAKEEKDLNDRDFA